ncbi:hypothetical protein JCM1841_003913, partial [Sporobolomyces salmonicolor]
EQPAVTVAQEAPVENATAPKAAKNKNVKPAVTVAQEAPVENATAPKAAKNKNVKPAVTVAQEAPVENATAPKAAKNKNVKPATTLGASFKMIISQKVAKDKNVKPATTVAEEASGDKVNHPKSVTHVNVVNGYKITTTRCVYPHTPRTSEKPLSPPSPDELPEASTSGSATSSASQASCKPPLPSNAEAGPSRKRPHASSDAVVPTSNKKAKKTVASKDKTPNPGGHTGHIYARNFVTGASSHISGTEEDIDNAWNGIEAGFVNLLWHGPRAGPSHIDEGPRFEELSDDE